ncbi:hypothetical protein [Streptomyces sp. NBC_00038]|uniref:hypothetical protein n=1 Tax=Streptomyces sp. NBC_00038 TaxID=2903615 RepID=UPI00225475FC|nr:hypothetical protein [Streptomyces sp. NBC_00038]MCX5559492.1 hypothetical protein [Streptomyces sp. NBC_00038]
MEESNAKRWARNLARVDRWRKNTTCHLQKWADLHGQDAQRQFVQGAASRLGSGAVTLLILWWETRR